LPILSVLSMAYVNIGLEDSLKNKLKYDDSLDVFGIHGVAGIAGSILLTFFIRSSWMEEAATLAGGTWTMWQQLGVQIAAVMIVIIYATVFSLVLPA
jgi:Amt family ammonium transporter